jgi:aminoglycoside phosphotransferase (APT) family kinase protein
MRAATVARVREPGQRLASGRDSDIFDCGPGLVLRRARRARSQATEARIMDYARAHGYPVPAIEEISDDGTDLVMERIEGPSMAAAIMRRPWTLRPQGAVLAGLHHRLHDIPSPDWLSPGPGHPGTCLLHLDLHPLNVILGAKGPVVIDWSNAARGDGAADAALTWILMAAAGMPAGRLQRAILGRARTVLVNSFLRQFDLAPVKAQLREVVAWKVQDANMTAPEQAAMWRLAAAVEERDGKGMRPGQV